MASVETFKFSAVHSHLTLVGFVTLAIYGLATHRTRQERPLGRRAFLGVRRRRAHFPSAKVWPSNGNGIALAVVGSMLVILSALQFVVAAWRAEND